ncbi:MAG: GGDEF domain-containing protein [bacterium]
MVSQSGLIILLVALVVILITLLVHRIRRERRHSAALDGLRPEELDTLLSSNAGQGSVAAVARRVSDILIGPGQCQIILFVRKKRGNLVCNYTHGLTDEVRAGLRLPHSKALLDHLQECFLPRDLTCIRPFLPEPFSSRLSGVGVDVYFPVFWRDNLYGIYFVKSNLETSHAFKLLVASLAQTLSATYHIKWQETRNETLAKELAESNRKSAEVRPQVTAPSSMAALVKHRNSESLIPRLVNSVKEDLGLQRAALVYDGPGRQGMIKVTGEGGDRNLSTPASKAFEQLLGRLDENSTLSLKEISVDIPPLCEWSRELQRSGMQYVAPFTLSGRRRCVLAFACQGEVGTIGSRLKLLRSHAVDLVANAEEYEEIEALSYTDNLTQLANRRYLTKRLGEEIARAGRYQRQLVLIIFDLDQLKTVNDQYGHHAGDTVLMQLSHVLRRSIRSIDIVARYGGDEFCVVMPEADATSCRHFMSRLQAKVARTPVCIDESGQSVSFTISLGGAVFPDHGTDADSLLRAADAALLRAKGRGRDCALMYDEADIAVE